MFKDTGPIDAASILLNLTDYRVINATHETTVRKVLIEPVATEATCRGHEPPTTDATEIVVGDSSKNQCGAGFTGKPAE